MSITQTATRTSPGNPTASTLPIEGDPVDHTPPTPAVDLLGLATDAVIDADRHLTSWYLHQDHEARRMRARAGLACLDTALATLRAAHDVITAELHREERPDLPEWRIPKRG